MVIDECRSLLRITILNGIPNICKIEKKTYHRVEVLVGGYGCQRSLEGLVMIYFRIFHTSL